MTAQPDNHIVPAFYFRVLFNGLEGSTDADAGFTSVSGIQATIQHDAVMAGQVERTQHTTVFQPAVLKRPISAVKDSALRRWIMQSLQKPLYHPLHEVRIEILNEAHEPQILILLKQVSVKHWALSELNAQQSAALMEEIWLDYKAIEFK